MNYWCALRVLTLRVVYDGQLHLLLDVYKLNSDVAKLQYEYMESTSLTQPENPLNDELEMQPAEEFQTGYLSPPRGPGFRLDLWRENLAIYIEFESRRSALRLQAVVAQLF